MSAMFKISYGLFILSAKEGEKDNGCIINTAMQVTQDPKQVSICVNKENYTCGMIERTGEFNLSILSEEADFEVFKHFGFNYEDKDTRKKIYTTEVYANRIEFAGAKMVDRPSFPEDAEGFLEIPEGMEEEMPFR